MYKHVSFVLTLACIRVLTGLLSKKFCTFNIILMFYEADYSKDFYIVYISMDSGPITGRKKFDIVYKIISKRKIVS